MHPVARLAGTGLFAFGTVVSSACQHVAPSFKAVPGAGPGPSAVAVAGLTAPPAGPKNLAAVTAAQSPHAADWPAAVSPQARAVLARLAADNANFVARHDDADFVAFRDAQKPALTLLGCSDARFQEDEFDAAPDGQVFTVRNIGNQLDLNEGSVAYGVHHLHTPVLLIVGHVACGAVRAALDDYGAASPALRRELNGLHLSLRHTHPGRPLAERWLSGVLDNVDQQVRDAVQLFAAEVSAGTLTGVGAVYDFRNDLRRGSGRLVWTNVNGQPWPADAQDAGRR